MVEGATVDEAGGAPIPRQGVPLVTEWARGWIVVASPAAASVGVAATAVAAPTGRGVRGHVPTPGVHSPTPGSNGELPLGIVIVQAAPSGTGGALAGPAAMVAIAELGHQVGMQPAYLEPVEESGSSRLMTPPRGATGGSNPECRCTSQCPCRWSRSREGRSVQLHRDPRPVPQGPQTRNRSLADSASLSGSASESASASVPLATRFPTRLGVSCFSTHRSRLVSRHPSALHRLPAPLGIEEVGDNPSELVRGPQAGADEGSRRGFGIRVIECDPAQDVERTYLSVRRPRLQTYASRWSSRVHLGQESEDLR